MPDSNMDNDLRDFDYAQDLSAVKRIWREVGWIEDDDEEAQLDHFFKVGHTSVGTINNVPECSVHVTPGTMVLRSSPLSLCAVTAVTTSRIARGRAFAQRLTARQLAYGVSQGASVAALGMFDQGFYDKLGFGTGAYDHEFTFDPATLMLSADVPSPERFSIEDADVLQDAMCQRNSLNGSVVLHPPESFRAELGFDAKGFGLGYRDDLNQVSHFIWLVPEGERGPYRVKYYAYRNVDQLVQLLGLLKSLADQVYSVTMMEPPEIQLQSLLSRPMRHMQLTKGGTHEQKIRTLAWWQLRALDVATCVSAVSDCAEEISFNLVLTDPITSHLAADSVWQGVGGDYCVKFGSRSSAESGSAQGLEQLVCSVNAFSRLLWGVASASSLAITDQFSAPATLLQSLDRALQIPAPKLGWDF